MSERLMLLDTAGLYYRAFFAVPGSVRAPDGRPIGAARGLVDMIAKFVTLYEPTHLVACWDDDWRPQWRVDLIDTYKTHRVAEVVPGGPDVEETPDELTAQLPAIHESLDALGIRVVGAAEHEADDVIGSLAAHSPRAVDVVTGDRDLFQLVDDDAAIRVIYTGRGMAKLEELDDAAVYARYGIHARQYADFAVLRGDPSDGLPGVAGIGEKSAAKLLAAHGDLGGIRRAAAHGELAAGVAARITAASAYLDVAPRVVEVVRDLPLGDVDEHIVAPDADSVHTVGARWGIERSLSRAADALTARANADHR